MTDPYRTLAAQLLAAARRQPGAPRSTRWWDRPHRRLRVAVVVLVLLLAGATIAVATGGLLSGSTVRPSGRLNPSVREGIPAPGGSRLLSLRVPDPQGGPPWGMRIVNTTRREVCVQIGRLRNGLLGELGIDGAFRNDGRFHALPPEVLPTNGPESGNAFCAPTGQTFTGAFTHLDRNAARTPRDTVTPADAQREVSFGLLGPRAVEITYRGVHGLRSGPVTAGTGGYLIVERTNHRSGQEDGFASGYGSATRRRPGLWGAVRAVTYRFADLVCSDGTGAKAAKPCPSALPAPASTILPTRSLHQALRITLNVRHGLINGAELEFAAPYAVTSAHQDYEVVEVAGPSGCGGAVDPLDRNINQGQKVRVKLDFPFPPAGSCGNRQEYEVRFVNPAGPSSLSAHESVIVGSTTITKPPATRPAGTG